MHKILTKTCKILHYW